MKGTYVSVVVPCRNEKALIRRCLDSILANDYPKNRMEILVVDGMSEDGTREIVAQYAKRHSLLKLLPNPKKITPSALNIGIRAARGDILMRMDAHTVYSPDYISRLVTWLEKSGADNVGGVCITKPAKNTAIAKAIATALSHPFGVGNSYFRIGSSKPRWVDTVPFGCYRREVFKRLGTFDEDLPRNQDDEFNFRLLKNGGRILLVPDVVCDYYPRDSLAKLWQMYHQYGYYKVLVMRKIGRALTIRQVIPALFISSLFVTGLLAPWSATAAAVFLGIVLAYLTADLGCSLWAARRQGPRCALALCVVFPLLHLSYGSGFLKGAANFLLLRRDA